MSRDRSRNRSRNRSRHNSERRQVLLGVAGGIATLGGAALGFRSGAFTSTTAARGSDVNAAESQNALIGLEVFSPVGRNPEDPLVTLENNTSSNVSVTITLVDPNHGTLFDPQGAPGSPAVFSLPVGVSKTVSIQALIKDSKPIPFTIAATGSEFDFDADRETTAVDRAIRVTDLQDFSAKTGANTWKIKQVQVQDNDNDEDLTSVEYEITDSSGTVVATRTDSGSYGGQYQVGPITIEPTDPGYDIQSGETYTLTVTANDVDGNWAEATRTADGSDDGTTPAIRIGKIQQFAANAGGQNNWTIKQVQVQDNDGDKDLDEVQFDVTDSNGVLRGSMTVNVGDQQKYQAKQVTINPNSGYSLFAGETYTLTLTAIDVDGNSVSDTRQATA